MDRKNTGMTLIKKLTIYVMNKIIKTSTLKGINYEKPIEGAEVSWEWKDESKVNYDFPMSKDLQKLLNKHKKYLISFKTITIDLTKADKEWFNDICTE